MILRAMASCGALALIAGTALPGVAWADLITLDSGAKLEGDLARFEFGGDCQISITEGDLSGVIVIVPCHRVASFVRTSPRMVLPSPGAEPAAAPSVLPLPSVEGAPVADPPAEALFTSTSGPLFAEPGSPYATLPSAPDPVPGPAAAPAVSAPADPSRPADGLADQYPEDAPHADTPTIIEQFLSASPFDDPPGSGGPDAEPLVPPAAEPAPPRAAEAVRSVVPQSASPLNQPRSAPSMGAPTVAPPTGPVSTGSVSAVPSPTVPAQTEPPEGAEAPAPEDAPPARAVSF